LQELTATFRTNAKGIRRFYDECWKVFNRLNRMELSLEEPRYLTRVFFQHPLVCLGLVKYRRRTLVTWRGATSAIHSY